MILILIIKHEIRINYLLINVSANISTSGHQKSESRWLYDLESF